MDIPFASVTTTGTELSTACLGVTAVSSSTESTSTELAAAPPISTFVSPVPFPNPLPLTVTGVPPSLEPNAGLMLAAVGGVTYA